MENMQIQTEESYPIINKITGLKGERRTDILYIIPFKNAETKLYILLEHKSNPETEFMRQLNEKIESIRIKEGDFILLRPVLFYQNENPWPYDWHMTRYWNLPEKLSATLTGEIMEYQVQLFDLGQMDPQTVKTCLTMRAFLYTMKYIRSKDIKERVLDICELLTKAQTENEWIVKISSYIFEYWDAQAEIVEEFETLITNSELRRESMALADNIFKKGAREAYIRIAERLLKKGMGVEEVLEVADITLEDLEDAGIIPRQS